MAIDYQMIPFSFATGLETKIIGQAMSDPSMDIARDVEFDTLGAARTRKPYTALSNNVYGGGTLTNPRKLGVNGDELVVFTDTGLYSWSPARSAWVSKGTHLAVEVVEEEVFGTTGDQFDTDRAELNGVVFYCWTNGAGSYVAARD